MLRIRLTRTGKKKQESFRVVVAEHTNAVKGKYIELLGYYLPTRSPKTFEIKKDRVEHWISKGAKPSSTTASLFKKHGFANMDTYIFTRQQGLKKKKDAVKGEQPAPAKTS